MSLVVVDVLLVAIIATSTVIIGTWAMSIEDKELEENPEVAAERVASNQEVTCSQALTFPLVASASLLVLFFFFDYVQFFLLFFLLYAAFMSARQLLHLVHLKVLSSRFPTIFNDCFPWINFSLTVFIALEWLRSGNVICHNMLGCALCVMFICTLRFPSLKMATICLTLLLVYDLFWVFFSEYVFSDNVMVAVATKQASNPVHLVVNQLNMEHFDWISPKIELPLKLLFPSIMGGRTMMLGLGDIALPGALVALARRCDETEFRNAAPLPSDLESNILQNNKFLYLHWYAIMGYFVSLLMAFAFNWWSGHAQPALIYLVPGVLLPIFIRSISLGKFSDVWNGRFKLEFSK